MYYVQAGFEGLSRSVGVYQTEELAQRMADNIGELFSSGIKPVSVTMRVVPERGGTYTETIWYNGYRDDVKSKSILGSF